jgi:hypothetical protein
MQASLGPPDLAVAGARKAAARAAKQSGRMTGASPELNLVRDRSSPETADRLAKQRGRAVGRREDVGVFGLAVSCEKPAVSCEKSASW